MHFDELSEEKIEREELAVEHKKSLSEHSFLEVYQENDRCKKFVLSWLVVWDAAKPVRLLPNTQEVK